jgi:8-oxo-dGTP pyrophosphatase MutT (NUDIX family)
MNSPAHWREQLRTAVTPLAHGVAALSVYGFSRTGQQPPRPARTAAVLVGVLDLDQPEILLTRRAAHLTHHPGQVSFPGGAMAAREETGVLTALREAEEEIGLLPANVEPIGFLDRVDTVSDYRVLPVVGLVHQSPPWVPDFSEVDEVFTIPLALVLDPDAYQVEPMERQGIRFNIHSLQWQDYRIWGVTAAILHNLALRTRGALPVSRRAGQACS